MAAAGRGVVAPSQALLLGLGAPTPLTSGHCPGVRRYAEVCVCALQFRHKLEGHKLEEVEEEVLEELQEAEVVYEEELDEGGLEEEEEGDEGPAQVRG